jgi:hypothetical protein
MEALNELIKELKELNFTIWDHLLDSDQTLIIKTSEVSAFQVKLEFDKQYSRFTVFIVIRTESSMFDGDRSDVTSLISFIASIYFKFSFRMKISLMLNEHPVVENEIHSVLLILRESKFIENQFCSASVNDIIEVCLMVNMLEYFMCQHFNFGPNSNLVTDIDEKWVEKFSKLLKFTKNYANCSARTNEAYRCIFSIKDGIIHYSFDKSLSLYNKIKENYHSKSISGVENLLLKIKGPFCNELVAVDFSAISKLKIIAEYSNDDSEKLYFPIDNCLIVLGKKTLTGIFCDCSTRVLATEIRNIKERQAIENEFLFEEKGFKWNSRINDDEFEKMIMELLYYEPGFWGIHKVGSTREGDGNRDLQALVTWIEKGKVKTDKVIIQCKAYQKSVGKSDIKDIRDTIENYTAKGFMVIASSRITVPLQDHLENLQSQKDYYIDWWNREDIEIRLRQHPEVLNRYSDIVNTYGTQLTFDDWSL